MVQQQRSRKKRAIVDPLKIDSVNALAVNGRKRRESMEPHEIDEERHRQQHENMEFEQIDADRDRHLHENMEQVLIDADRDRHLHENMGAEQVDGHRDNRLIVNCAPSRVERIHAADNSRYQSKREVRQEWDRYNACRWCSRIWLKSTSSNTRKLCCQNGKLLNLRDAKIGSIQMGTLTGPLLDLAEGVCADNDPYFFSRFSNVYNSHLSMSAVGVDNGRNEGWDTIFGDHAVRITGRTYHFFKTTGRSCGLQFYIHNATALVDEKNERT